MRTLACFIVAILMQACFSTAPRAGDADVGDGPVDPGPDSIDTMDVPVDPDVDMEVPEGVCPWGWDCRVATFPHFTGVDILFVIDNSLDMATYQRTFIDQFSLLVGAFLDPEIDSTGMPEHAPVTNIHVGVVSADMGTGEYEVPTCAGPPEGDDGLLLHEPRLEGCYPTYPVFLLYDEDSPNPIEISDLEDDFRCIASLGNEGCGFEQPLESALKALTTHSQSGRHNDGFLRRTSVGLIVWISTENDCSVVNEDLYDLDNPEYGPAGLRCASFPEALHPMMRYIDGFSGLATSRPVLLGMIVGVPPDEERCNASGTYIGACLDLEEMDETTDPGDPSRLRPVCSFEGNEAWPARRFVELAQSFGPHSYVYSICHNDYAPAFEALSEMVGGFTDLACSPTHIALMKSPSDRCHCITDCAVLHVLADASPCPPGTWEWDADSDTIPNVVHDSSGRTVSACEVPYAGTQISDCWDSCHDPHQMYTPLEEGWYYSFSSSGVACPSPSFTSGFGPPAGSTTIVLCP